MDLDHIRVMVQLGDVRYTDKFDRMLQARDFSVEQAHAVVLQGREIDRESRPKMATKIILQHAVEREPSIVADLIIEIAVTDVVIFISGYWPGDSPRQR